MTSRAKTRARAAAAASLTALLALTACSSGDGNASISPAVDSGATIIDVRTPAEHEAMPIPGGINIELDRLRERLGELPEGELVVHCQAGLRGYLAARVLAQHGRRAVNLDGGYLTWAARPGRDEDGTTAAGDDADRGSSAG